ncbi:MAG: hypothetical protein LZF60_380197 [Nitrospira sp.]|nr:MAG: hypothetical protein LZF60_380197 [Nitrospira sp.]
MGVELRPPVRTSSPEPSPSSEPERERLFPVQLNVQSDWNGKRLRTVQFRAETAIRTSPRARENS